MSFHFRRFAARFKSLYTGKYAVVTNTITAGCLGSLSDFLAQCAENFHSSDKSWDKYRSKNMAILSTGFGVFFHYWYRFLDNRYAGKSTKAVSRKVVIDLAISPCFYFAYLGGLNFLKGMSRSESWEELKIKFPVVFGADLICWPLLQTFNFLFFPPYYRIIGLKVNELTMGILFSHIVNNSYSVQFFIDWLQRQSKSK